MSPETPNAIKIFFSYAHEDEELRDRLAKHLSTMKRNGEIDDWHDRQIVAGREWASAIDERLDTAQIILLLISADFLASDYCSSIELSRAMERHEAKEDNYVVIPVILHACDWEKAPFGKLQALPKDGKPVSSWLNWEEAFTDIAKGIRRVVEKLRAAQGSPDDPLPQRGGARLPVPPLLPYLCDRSDQEIELGRVLSNHRKQTPRRPFVCIVHGDEFECHSDFLDRLQQVSLPGVLELRKRGLSIEDYTLRWPSNIRPGQASETFLGMLGLSLADHSAVPADKLFDHIPLERPVMLTVRLKTEDFATGGTEALASYFKFWEEWKDLPPGRTLLNVVSIRYRRIEELSFFRRWKLKKVDKDLRAYLGQLNFSPQGKLPGIILPELEAITHQHVVTWSRSKDVRAICEIREQEIDKLFQRKELCTPGGHIPMQFLADELTNLVIKNRR